jgi:hypothetical protein
MGGIYYYKPTDQARSLDQRAEVAAQFQKSSQPVKADRPPECEKQVVDSHNRTHNNPGNCPSLHGRQYRAKRMDPDISRQRERATASREVCHPAMRTGSP